MIDKSWFIFAGAIALGFPLMTILLGELMFFLEKKRNTSAEVVRILRNWVLPTLTFFLILKHIFLLPDDNILSRLGETILWISIIYWGLTFINQMLFRDAREDSWRANVPKIFLDLSRTFLVLVGAAIVCSTVWGADLAGLLTAFGVGSLVIGLALQDSLGNIFSGITLLFEKPVSIGDWVKIGDVKGQVKEITWRSVHVYTPDRHLVIVPNTELAQGSFINYSHDQDIHGVEMEIGVSYDDPPNKVIPLLKQAALQSIGIYSEPEPQIFLINYADFAIVYKIRFFVKDFPQGVRSSHDLNVRIWYVFQRHGITIPFPIEVQHQYHSTLPTKESLEDKGVEVLKTVPGFNVMADQFLKATCEDANFKTFTKGELIISENQSLSGLFVVLEGRAEMSVYDPVTKENVVISNLIIGDIFGAKSVLLSGQISNITVNALDDLLVLIISMNKLHRLVEEYPILAHKLTEIIELRQQQINSVIDNHPHSKMNFTKS